jgi:murein lipoprotein
MMEIKMTQTRRLLALAAVAALYTGLSGCASTGELASLKSQIDQATADAAAAKAEAATASSDAASAKAMAEQAVNTANQAMSLSQETDSKIDRMFKKAMYK